MLQFAGRYEVQRLGDIVIQIRYELQFLRVGDKEPNSGSYTLQGSTKLHNFSYWPLSLMLFL
jgi:hypothetical protein